MFLKFFLTYIDSNKSYGSPANMGTSRWTPSMATTHTNFKFDRKETTTFNKIRESLISQMHRYVEHDTGRNFSNEILINISDEKMFQLETLSVYEYCYCTYNLESGLIGFGSTKRRAADASDSPHQPYKSTGWGTTAMIANDNLFFNFYPEETEVPEFEFVLPDGFYDSVLSELKPYIQHTKQEIFKSVCSTIKINHMFIVNFLNEFYEKDRESYYNGESINIREHELVYKMFMNDDIDILGDSLKEERSMLACICLDLMKLSNETF